jgi:hypothetical protein
VCVYNGTHAPTLDDELDAALAWTKNFSISSTLACSGMPAMSTVRSATNTGADIT